MTTASTMILGTKATVVSFNWVAACKMLMINPTINSPSRIGPLRKSAIHNAWNTSSITSEASTLAAHPETLNERCREDPPSVCHHKD